MSFKDHEQYDRRLHILRLLLSADYAMPHTVLISALQDYGHTVSTDGIHDDLSELHTLDLLTHERQGTMTVATLTQKGVDVAMGRETVAGIRRPSIDEVNEMKAFMEKHHGG